MGVRIASLLTTMSSSRSAAVVPVSPSGITFRSALANLSKRADAESDSTESDSQTNSGSGAASRFLTKQDKAQASSDSSSRTTATLPPASVVVANGRTWHTTRTMTGVRIASASTKTPSSTPATASPVNSSKQTKPDNDTLSGARTPSDADALTTVTTPPTDQSVSSVADRSSGQDKVTRASDGSSGTYAQTSDVPSSTAALDLAQQLIPSHAVTDPADGNATAVKQLNAAPPSDVMVAEEGQGLAPATPSGAPQAGAGIAAQIAGESFTVPMGLPAAAAPTSHGDWSMPAGKATAKETNSTSGAKNPDLGSTTEPGKSKAGDAAGTGSDGWSHGTQNSSQSTQHSQGDPSQGAAAPAKSIDSGASQLQVALMHGASHEVATFSSQRERSGKFASPNFAARRPRCQRVGHWRCRGFIWHQCRKAHPDDGSDGDERRNAFQRIRQYLDSHFGLATADAGPDIAGSQRLEPGPVIAYLLAAIEAGKRIRPAHLDRGQSPRGLVIG